MTTRQAKRHLPNFAQLPLIGAVAIYARVPLCEREGYTALLKAIAEGSINVLFLIAADHLFESATELQVNTFVHLCIVKRVYVVTLDMVYDFRNLAHIALFRTHFVKAFE